MKKRTKKKENKKHVSNETRFGSQHADVAPADLTAIGLKCFSECETIWLFYFGFFLLLFYWIFFLCFDHGQFRVFPTTFLNNRTWRLKHFIWMHNSQSYLNSYGFTHVLFFSFEAYITVFDGVLYLTQVCCTSQQLVNVFNQNYLKWKRRHFIWHFIIR